MHTSHYTRLKKPTATYILHVRIVPITTHAHVKVKSIGKKKETKKRKGKKRKEKKAKKERKEKKTQDKKRKQGKNKEKNVILADPRNLLDNGRSPVAPVAYQVIPEPGISQLREN